jgi:hypothetical protein
VHGADLSGSGLIIFYLLRDVGLLNHMTRLHAYLLFILLLLTALVEVVKEKIKVLFLSGGHLIRRCGRL